MKNCEKSKKTEYLLPFFYKSALEIFNISINCCIIYIQQFMETGRLYGTYFSFN
ncbi:hypothetical protein JOC70_001615 [Clostridium pascui]|nr:hypothetical protein [Clostridium pascui]